MEKHAATELRDKRGAAMRLCSLQRLLRDTFAQRLEKENLDISLYAKKHSVETNQIRRFQRSEMVVCGGRILHAVIDMAGLSQENEDEIQSLGTRLGARRNSICLYDAQVVAAAYDLEEAFSSQSNGIDEFALAFGAYKDVVRNVLRGSKDGYAALKSRETVEAIVDHMLSDKSKPSSTPKPVEDGSNQLRAELEQRRQQFGSIRKLAKAISLPASTLTYAFEGRLAPRTVKRIRSALDAYEQRPKERERRKEDVCPEASATPANQDVRDLLSSLLTAYRGVVAALVDVLSRQGAELRPNEQHLIARQVIQLMQSAGIDEEAIVEANSGRTLSEIPSALRNLLGIPNERGKR